jgi:hypothetical protein
MALNLGMFANRINIASEHWHVEDETTTRIFKHAIPLHIIP